MKYSYLFGYEFQPLLGPQWQAITSLHVLHFAKRLKNSFLISSGCSKRSSLTIFLQFISYCKSTAVMPRGGVSLRSVTIADFKMVKPQRLSYTSLHISPFQQSLWGSRLGILLQVVEAWWRAHWIHLVSHKQLNANALGNKWYTSERVTLHW